jgi:hypothetical protein
LGDFVEFEVSCRNITQQHLQQLLADRGVGQAQSELAVAQVGCAQPRVDAVRHRRGRDEGDFRGGHRGAQFGEDQRRDRVGGGR